MYHDSITEERQLDSPVLEGGEGEGLLKSAGRDAKDGVQAIQQGYGSFDKSPSKLLNTENTYTDGPAREPSISVDRMRFSMSEPDRPLVTRNDSQDSNESNDTLAHYHLQAIAQLVERSKVLLEVAVSPRILSRQVEFGRLS